MTEPSAKSRDVAVWALADRAGNVSARLEAQIARAELAPADRALARELAMGTVRRQATLEAILRAFLRHPDHRMPGALHEIVLVGLYQILFLDRVPDFAAVNEAVEQAGRMRHRRQAGMVNGVLRTVVRSLSPPEATGPRFAPDAVPVAGKVFRTTGRPVFADPQTSPAEYLAQAYSLPPALAERWVGRFGGVAAAARIADHANARPPLILRVNALRADPQEVLDALAAAGVEAALHDNGTSVALSRWVDVRQLAVFQDGLVQPQDPTATAVVAAADPQPGMRVLDFCAAPGTKTTHLAERMANTGEIVAVDVSGEKLARIDTNCARMGIDIVTTMLAEEVGSLDPGSFDLAMADVPCSNTGVLSRRPEARWRFAEDGLRSLVRDQRTLAALASQFVRPGGKVAYSTCSIEPEESYGVAKWLTETRRGLSVAEEELTLPHGAGDPGRWCDGGSCAILAVQ